MDQVTYNIKRARGCILSGLAAFYPNGVSGNVIYTELLLPTFPNLDFVEFLRDLDYLQERGFVEPIADALGRAQSARKRLFRVTASGIDVGNGIVSDPAIEVEV